MDSYDLKCRIKKDSPKSNYSYLFLLLFRKSIPYLISFHFPPCRLWSSGCRSRYQGGMGRFRFLKRPFCIIGKSATSGYWDFVAFRQLDFVSINKHLSTSHSCRCSYYSGLSRGIGAGSVRCVCHRCITRIKILPNIAHGANGPTRRHLEAIGQRSLCPSPGEFYLTEGYFVGLLINIPR